MQRPQGQRRRSSSATPTPMPNTTTHATASGTALMRLHSQWLRSGAEEDPQATRVFFAIRQDRFVGGRSSEGPERRGRNAQQTVQVSSGSDRGKRRRCPWGTTGSNRPRTHSDGNVGTYVLRANRHRRASADDNGDQPRIPNNDSNETPGLLTLRQAAPGTHPTRGCHHLPAGWSLCRLRTVAGGGPESGTFQPHAGIGPDSGVWAGEEPSCVVVAAHYPVRLVREKGA
jgi:hypothetical protein